MLRALMALFAALMLLSPIALAQEAAAAPVAPPAGGATTVSTTAPGNKSTVTITFNNRVTAPTNVWVGGQEVPLNQWEWEFVSTSKKKIRITMPAPAAGDKVEVRVDYPGTKPSITGTPLWT